MIKLNAVEVEKLSKILLEMSVETKKHNPLLKGIPDYEVVRLVNKEVEKLMEDKANSPDKHTEMYDQLVKEKADGRVLGLADITNEILAELIKNEDISEKLISELFNTTRANVNSLKKKYKITLRGKVMDDYMRMFTIACEKVRVMTILPTN